MFHVTFERLWAGESHLSVLDEQAKKGIRTRGYGLAAKVPADLANPEWFLAVNDIAYSYCPTSRYLYFRKKEGKRPAPTWESYKGRIVDKLIPEIYRKTYEYSISTSLRNLRIVEKVQESLREVIDDYKSGFVADSLLNPPLQSDVDQFFDDILKLIDHETSMASVLLNYRVSNVYDVNMETEFKILFPFDFKLKISSPFLGISGSAEVDFLLKGSILGEIKSTKWFEFYNVGLAGYALAYEDDRKKDVNLGVVVCPVFLQERNIPMYSNRANIRIVTESWRKIFLVNRNARMGLIKRGEDPGRAEDATKCLGCGFHTECWEQ